MNIIDQLALFTSFDFAALALLFVLWFVIGWRVEHPSHKFPSTTVIMANYRRKWMEQMVQRDPRMFDAQILASLRQGTAFFASTSVIALGGTLALIGNADRLAGLAQDITLAEQPIIVWELKLLIVAFFLTNGFLKFVWSNRLFGYCAVLMAAVPNDPEDPQAYPRASQAAEICITAARSFNKGLRATYFALTAVAWILGPTLLMFATLTTLALLYRREFASHSRSVLLKLPPDTQS